MIQRRILAAGPTPVGEDANPVRKSRCSIDGTQTLRKAILHPQQVEHQAGIAPIMFLFPGFGRTNLGRMSHPTFDAQLFQQFQEPLHRTGGFDAYHYRTFQGRAKLSYGISFMAKCLLGELAGLGVQ